MAPRKTSTSSAPAQPWAERSTNHPPSCTAPDAVTCTSVAGASITPEYMFDPTAPGPGSQPSPSSAFTAPGMTSISNATTSSTFSVRMSSLCAKYRASGDERDQPAQADRRHDAKQELPRGNQ